jgi:hypothetical protein
MTIDERDDHLLRELRRLSVLSLDESRLERVRDRCHRAIARRQLHEERSTRRAAFFRRVLEPVFVGGLCLVFLSSLFLNVFRVLMLN